MHKIYAKKKLKLWKSDNIQFVTNIKDADFFKYPFYKHKIKKVWFKTVDIDDEGNVYCIDISLLSSDKVKAFFNIGKITDGDLLDKINYVFSNLEGILLHNMCVLTDLIKMDASYFDSIQNIGLLDFLKKNVGYNNEKYLIKWKKILSPSNLVLNNRLFRLYNLIINKLESNIFFDDIILSLIPFKYWGNSLFFLKSRLTFKLSTFFNKYEDVISLQVPVARSVFLKDLFDSLLLQTNLNFKLLVWVDAYDDEEKRKILEIIKSYKNKFKNFNYFVNEKNLWVWKTRWKLMNLDKTSKYVVFLDDDVFLDYEAIDNLYNVLLKYPNIGLYSIENVDVRFDVDYKDYIFKNKKFEQPGVYTDRRRVWKYPLYANQEETPVIFNRFYVDLLNEPYHKTFDKCSLDLFYNRLLSLICWNINIKWVYQFNRIWHRYHQTKEKGFLYKEFEYVLYLLDRIAYLSNDKLWYDLIIKVQELKSDELFK